MGKKNNIGPALGRVVAIQKRKIWQVHELRWERAGKLEQGLIKLHLYKKYKLVGGWLSDGNLLCLLSLQWAIYLPNQSDLRMSFRQKDVMCLQSQK
jgi:hypothetical protein